MLSSRASCASKPLNRKRIAPCREIDRGGLHGSNKGGGACFITGNPLAVFIPTCLIFTTSGSLNLYSIDPRPVFAAVEGGGGASAWNPRSGTWTATGPAPGFGSLRGAGGNSRSSGGALLEFVSLAEGAHVVSIRDFCLPTTGPGLR